jgi:hypothetical protein
MIPKEGYDWLEDKFLPALAKVMPDISWMSLAKRLRLRKLIVKHLRRELRQKLSDS